MEFMNEIFDKSRVSCQDGKASEILIVEFLVVKRWDKTKVYVHTAANANEALHLVLKERRKELLMTGLRHGY
ncbi:hypothetical protein CS542_02140 [Pedobacter sp. IW39]|nr:hypothetical protein CS542_02140 [Pedobacter sp. IW39]